MKKAVTQKILSLFLAFCVIFTLAPMNVYALGANDIVRIAAGEVGNSGRPNKYTRWCGSINGSYSYAWCACFVGWCANQAGESAAIPKTASVRYLAEGIKRAGGQPVSDPQAGDIVVYRRRSDDYYAHVGIMENGSTSIEGNYSNGVHRGINPYRYSYGGASVGNGGIELIFLRPNYKSANTNTAPAVQYFDCNVQINTTAGKTVGLYNNPIDSSRRTAFTKGQSAQSTWGAKLSNGSTWYQIQVNHQGQIIALWLNAASEGVTVTDLKPSTNPSTAPAVQYFDCNVQINTTVGKAVGLYSDPGGSRKTVFTKGQTAYSTRGAKLSDGSTWYQIQVNHQGQIIALWLNAGNDGITVTNLKPDTYSMDLSVDSITLSPNESQTISIQYGWTNTPPYRIDFQFNSDNVATAGWGKQSGRNVQLNVDAQNPGTTTLNIWLSNADGLELCKKTVTVNVMPSNQTVGTPINLGSEFNGYIYNPGLDRYLTNDATNTGNVSSRSYNNSASQLWKFTRQSDGSYFIVSLLNGHDSLDVKEFGTSSGTTVRAYPLNKCSAQRWYILGTPEPGKYIITAACTQCVLDINGNSNAEGERVQMYKYNGTGAQIFEIKFAS